METDKTDRMPSDYHDIGPECFAYGNEIVSWRGQEFIRTCGEFVKALPDGGLAFCTMAFNHPASVPHMNVHHLEEADEEESNLVKHARLAPLTDDPDEWYKHSAEMWDCVVEIWQNKRNTKMFSPDKGKSYWILNNPSESKSSMPANMKDQPRPRSENYGR